MNSRGMRPSHPPTPATHPPTHPSTHRAPTPLLCSGYNIKRKNFVVAGVKKDRLYVLSARCVGEGRVWVVEREGGGLRAKARGVGLAPGAGWGGTEGVRRRWVALAGFWNAQGAA